MPHDSLHVTHIVTLCKNFVCDNEDKEDDAEVAMLTEVLRVILIFALFRLFAFFCLFLFLYFFLHVILGTPSLPNRNVKCIVS